MVSEITLLHLDLEVIVAEVSVGVMELFFLNKILILYDNLYFCNDKRNLILVLALFYFI